MRLYLLEMKGKLRSSYFNNMAALKGLNNAAPTDKLRWKGGIPQDPTPRQRTGQLRTSVRGRINLPNEVLLNLTFNIMQLALK